MSNYYDIEDTREDNVEIIDPLEWWERVMDYLPKELQDFVEDQLQEHNSKVYHLMQQNRALRQKIEEGKHD